MFGHADDILKAQQEFKKQQFIQEQQGLWERANVSSDATELNSKMADLANNINLFDHADQPDVEAFHSRWKAITKNPAIKSSPKAYSEAIGEFKAELDESGLMSRMKSRQSWAEQVKAEELQEPITGPDGRVWAIKITTPDYRNGKKVARTQLITAPKPDLTEALAKATNFDEHWKLLPPKDKATEFKAASDELMASESRTEPPSPTEVMKRARERVSAIYGYGETAQPPAPQEPALDPRNVAAYEEMQRRMGVNYAQPTATTPVNAPNFPKHINEVPEEMRVEFAAHLAQPKNAAERASLNSGTIYLAPDGSIHTVP